MLPPCSRQDTQRPPQVTQQTSSLNGMPSAGQWACYRSPCVSASSCRSWVASPLLRWPGYSICARQLCVNGWHGPENGFVRCIARRAARLSPVTDQLGSLQRAQSLLRRGSRWSRTKSWCRPVCPVWSSPTLELHSRGVRQMALCGHAVTSRRAAPERAAVLPVIREERRPNHQAGALGFSACARAERSMLLTSAVASPRRAVGRNKDRLQQEGRLCDDDASTTERQPGASTVGEDSYRAIASGGRKHGAIGFELAAFARHHAGEQRLARGQSEPR